jgi:hypothetical protein
MRVPIGSMKSCLAAIVAVLVLFTVTAALLAYDVKPPSCSVTQMAVVSSDHADESLCAEHVLPLPALKDSGAAPSPRLFSPDEVQQHDGQDGRSFWGVVDGFVVDASEFMQTHPGGIKKLLSVDTAAAGASGRPFGFSFSRGRNAHFPDTGRRFQDGVKRFLGGGGGRAILPAADVEFPPYGKITILGKLAV